MAKGFVSAHPWMTFFLALATVGAVEVIFNRKNVAAKPAGPSPQTGTSLGDQGTPAAPAHPFGGIGMAPPSPVPPSGIDTSTQWNPPVPGGVGLPPARQPLPPIPPAMPLPSPTQYSDRYVTPKGVLES